MLTPKLGMYLDSLCMLTMEVLKTFSSCLICRLISRTRFVLLDMEKFSEETRKIMLLIMDVPDLSYFLIPKRWLPKVLTLARCSLIHFGCLVQGCREDPWLLLMEIH